MATLTARVGGMTCGASVRHVEQALGDVPGARSVRVDLAAREAVVEHDDTATVHAMRAAVEAAVFTLEPARGLPAPVETLRALVSRPAVVGPAAALLLLGVYLGFISLAQGWDHALQQVEQDRPSVLLLAAGFGMQASLSMRLRARHARAAAGGASLAASGGTSTAAMLACCAHHLTEILPILGVSGLAVFLGTYKTPLLWLGLAMNLAGISYLTWQLRRPRSSGPSPRPDRQAGPGMSSLRWPRRYLRGSAMSDEWHRAVLRRDPRPLQTLAAADQHRRVTFARVLMELRKHHFAVLSTVGADGVPHSAGVSYGISSSGPDFAIYVMTRTHLRKARDIAQHPRVSVVVPLTRRFLWFLPPATIQLHGRAEILDWTDQEGTDVFRRFWLGRRILNGYQASHRRGETRICFLRITPDPVIATYLVGSSIWDLRHRMEAGAARVSIPR